MGDSILRDGLPVRGFLYSPFIAILLAVFPPLGLNASLVLWGILQAAAIPVCIMLFYRLTPSQLPIQVLFPVLILLSYPWWLNFFTGNTSSFIMVALLGSLLAIERRHHFIAAALLAFAVSFKFYPAIFLLPFLAGRQLRLAVVVTVACAAVLVVIPGIVLGAGQTIDFYDALLTSFRNTDWVASNPHSQFFPHLAMRLLGITAADAPLMQWIVYVISYSIAAGNLVFVYLVQRARVNHHNLWSFLIVFLTTPFILKTSWPIDFVYLPFAQSVLIWYVAEKQKGMGIGSGDTRHHPKSRTTVLCLVLTSILLSNVVSFNLLANFSLYGAAGFLFLATILLLVAVYVALLPVLWRSDSFPRS